MATEAILARLRNHDYSSQYPEGISVDEVVKTFIAHYYAAVDTPGAHDAYANSFSENAVLSVPTGAEVKGREELRRLHEKMWHGSVETRRHTPSKVFPFGSGSDELVVIGTVEYWNKDGSYNKNNMASHLKYQRTAANSRIEMYALRVWLN